MPPVRRRRDRRRGRQDIADRYATQDLIAFAGALLTRAGLDSDKASVTGSLLVEADLMGHSTHGLQLCGAYLKDIAAGHMTRSGEPEVLADHGQALTWDGRRLPGLWLTARAVDTGVERARAHGLAAIAIRRSHHIGCLAAFLPRATEHGCMVMLASSDPSMASVAPFGGVAPLFTPNPIAIGIPTDGDPVLIDISTSITTNGLTGRLHGQGRRLPGPWVMDSAGSPTDDPGVLFADPPGTILPIGGREYGHKGFGLALMIEALTRGLSGFGRADGPTDWGASVFVLVIDPAAFGGDDAFRRQTGWLAEASRASAPAPGFAKVRVPGDGALARRRANLSEGVELYPGIMEGLSSWAADLGVDPPAPL